MQDRHDGDSAVLGIVSSWDLCRDNSALDTFNQPAIIDVPFSILARRSGAAHLMQMEFLARLVS